MLDDLFPLEIKTQRVTNNGRLEDYHQVNDDDDPAGKDSKIPKESSDHLISFVLLATI